MYQTRFVPAYFPNAWLGITLLLAAARRHRSSALIRAADGDAVAAHWSSTPRTFPRLRLAATVRTKGMISLAARQPRAAASPLRKVTASLQRGRCLARTGPVSQRPGAELARADAQMASANSDLIVLSSLRRRGGSDRNSEIPGPPMWPLSRGGAASANSGKAVSFIGGSGR